MRYLLALLSMLVVSLALVLAPLSARDGSSKLTLQKRAPPNNAKTKSGSGSGSGSGSDPAPGRSGRAEQPGRRPGTTGGRAIARPSLNLPPTAKPMPIPTTGSAHGQQMPIIPQPGAKPGQRQHNLLVPPAGPLNIHPGRHRATGWAQQGPHASPPQRRLRPANIALPITPLNIALPITPLNTDSRAAGASTQRSRGRSAGSGAARSQGSNPGGARNNAGAGVGPSGAAAAPAHRSPSPGPAPPAAQSSSSSSQRPSLKRKSSNSGSAQSHPQPQSPAHSGPNAANPAPNSPAHSGPNAGNSPSQSPERSFSSRTDTEPSSVSSLSSYASSPGGRNAEGRRAPWTHGRGRALSPEDPGDPDWRPGKAARNGDI